MDKKILVEIFYNDDDRIDESSRYTATATVDNQTHFVSAKDISQCFTELGISINCLDIHNQLKNK